jgi:hypothetical protein
LNSATVIRGVCETLGMVGGDGGGAGHAQQVGHGDVQVDAAFAAAEIDAIQVECAPVDEDAKAFLQQGQRRNAADEQPGEAFGLTLGRHAQLLFVHARLLAEHFQVEFAVARHDDQQGPSLAALRQHDQRLEDVRRGHA